MEWIYLFTTIVVGGVVTYVVYRYYIQSNSRRLTTAQITSHALLTATTSVPDSKEQQERWEITSTASSTQTSTQQEAPAITLTAAHKKERANLKGTLRKFVGKAEDEVEKLDNVLKAVLDFITPHLQTEGILRISGNANKAKELYKDIKTGKAIGKNVDIHVVISALKEAIKHNALKIDFKVNQGSFALSFNYIKALFNGGMQKEAAIIYNLLHLGYLVQSNQSKNSMTPYNIAVSLAPSFQLLLKIPEDQQLKQLQDMIALLEQTVKSQEFSKPFQEVFNLNPPKSKF
jgi:hypothetical protein